MNIKESNDNHTLYDTLLHELKVKHGYELGQGYLIITKEGRGLSGDSTS